MSAKPVQYTSVNPANTGFQISMQEKIKPNIPINSSQPQFVTP